MKNLVKKIQNAAHEHNLWKKGSKIVIGVSGGPDSVCLLDVFFALAPKYDFALIVTHVNYGLRGKESARDEKFVRCLAKKYGLQFEILKSKNIKINEDALRNIRYDFFEKIRRENKFDLIAVAHNADDQAETFLMRVIRGAGLRGLCAMNFKSGNVIRPLLGVSRREILEYLEKNRLEYRIDKTNKKNIYFRNKVRNQLIPYLEKNFNPNLRRTIANSAVSIADDYELISEMAEQHQRSDNKLDADALLAFHPAIRRRIILAAIRRVKGDIKNIEAKHIDEILKIIVSRKNKKQTLLFQGLKIERKGDNIFMCLNQH